MDAGFYLWAVFKSIDERSNVVLSRPVDGLAGTDYAKEREVSWSLALSRDYLREKDLSASPVDDRVTSICLRRERYAGRRRIKLQDLYLKADVTVAVIIEDSRAS